MLKEIGNVGYSYCMPQDATAQRDEAATSPGSQLTGIADDLVGCTVRVFLHNGTSLSGTLICAKGRLLRIKQEGSSKESLANLDYVVSIVKS